jgi:hypothetical protein
MMSWCHDVIIILLVFLIVCHKSLGHDMRMRMGMRMRMKFERNLKEIWKKFEWSLNENESKMKEKW